MMLWSRSYTWWPTDVIRHPFDSSSLTREQAKHCNNCTWWPTDVILQRRSYTGWHSCNPFELESRRCHTQSIWVGDDLIYVSSQISEGCSFHPCGHSALMSQESPLPSVLVRRAHSVNPIHPCGHSALMSQGYHHSHPQLKKNTVTPLPLSRRIAESSYEDWGRVSHQR